MWVDTTNEGDGWVDEEAGLGTGRLWADVGRLSRLGSRDAVFRSSESGEYFRLAGVDVLDGPPSDLAGGRAPFVVGEGRMPFFMGEGLAPLLAGDGRAPATGVRNTSSSPTRI